MNRNRLSFVFMLLLALAIQTGGNAQVKFETRNAKVSFKSKTPIEEIYSENNQVSSFLKTEGNKKIIAFNVLMRSFKFHKALMEEHFNEKYVHTEKNPSAKFIGQIETDIDLKKPGIYKSIPVKGPLTFHGVTKQIDIIADLEVKQNKEIIAFSTFNINPEDYNVEIPKLVMNKISKNISITVSTLYKLSN